jgi:hypothetical protein
MNIGAARDLHDRNTPDRKASLGKRSFLPIGDSLVSTRIGSRVDVVPCTRNGFLSFRSLSSLISMPCHHFAEVASHLMKIETAVNIPLGLPLRIHNLIL